MFASTRSASWGGTLLNNRAKRNPDDARELKLEMVRLGGSDDVPAKAAAMPLRVIWAALETVRREVAAK